MCSFLLLYTSRVLFLIKFLFTDQKKKRIQLTLLVLENCSSFWLIFIFEDLTFLMYTETDKQHIMFASMHHACMNVSMLANMYTCRQLVKTSRSSLFKAYNPAVACP